MSNYEYPTLRWPEIVQILSHFDIATVTEHDIIYPKPAFVLHLYTCILNHLDFLLKEDNEQVEVDALEYFENPGLHVGSVPTIKLYLKIKELLNALECPKKFTFNFADLLKPDTHRTEFFLGALLNFSLDRDKRMNSITQVVDEFNVLEQKLVEIEENKIMQLKLEIAECNEAREREMPSVHEVDAKVKELHQTIENLKKEQRSLETTLKKLKERTVEMDYKISDAKYGLLQNVQKNANLRSKIVQSPDKLHRALEEKIFAREEARKAEKLAKNFFYEKGANVEVFSMVKKKMSKHYKQIEATQEQVNSAKSIAKYVKELKAKLSDEKELEKSFEFKLFERQSEVKHVEKLKKQLEKECSIKKEEGTKYLSRNKLEVESKRYAIETRQRNVEAVLSKVGAINSTITSVKESVTVNVDQLDCKYKEIAEEIHKHFNSIACLIESGPKNAISEGAGFDNLVSV